MAIFNQHRKRQPDLFGPLILLVALAAGLTIFAQAQASNRPLNQSDCLAHRTPLNGQHDAPVVGSRALYKSRVERCQSDSGSALQVLDISAVFTR